MKRKKDDIRIIHEDPATIVVDKPAGMLTVPDRFSSSSPNLLSWLREKRPDAMVMLVHRLDRDASGILLFAKGRDAQRFYSGEFAHRRVGKVYIALVHGVPRKLSGTVRTALRQHPRVKGRMVTAASGRRGKPASTRYEVIERFSAYTLVRAMPREGYHHQVRVHLASAGAPVVCDDHNGNGEPLLLSAIKRGYVQGRHTEIPLMDRLALHAACLRIAGFPDGEVRTFAADLPRDFELTLRNLYRYATGRPAAVARAALETLRYRLTEEPGSE